MKNLFQNFKDENFQSVIIIGAARSGTNMLRDVLISFSNFSSWDCDEINPIWHYKNENLKTDELKLEDCNYYIKSYVQNQFLSIAQKNNDYYVVEKTCANSFRIPFVYNIMPNAKYLFVFRDGRDVVASAIKRWYSEVDWIYTFKKARYVPLRSIPFYFYDFVKKRIHQVFSGSRRLPFWGPKYDGIEEDLKKLPVHVVAARQWKYSIRKSLKFIDENDELDSYILKYEDFVENPEEEISRIFNFLGHSHVDNKDVSKMVYKKSVGKWHQDLSEKQKEDVLNEIDNELRILKYF